MDWLSDNLASTLAVIGLLLLAIEIAVLGFATFVLLFVGIAALITSGLFYLDIVPATYLNAFISVGILTAVSAALLYRPLLQMQQQVEKKPVTSDLNGVRFVLAEAIGPSAVTTHAYSGIHWTVKSQLPIPAGTEVEVVNVEVGVLHVVPALKA
ncbi:NfeD family protein [Aestuariibacter sp. GS-14]|uniref:NfeD family protein n=1 Tax=Aestuariibacter sp. GS-14 TaxID=2590670 RepID=UPI00112C57C4|nr:NfeD family protein [Aestuariibacter sp. GS-14]TPV54273.1 NfeD family protein [Aestuariibacter sp. GS-14]